MTEIIYTDNVVVDGSRDIEQLRVQGHSTQIDPIQTWEDSAGGVLAQVTGDGRLIVGDDVTPDSLIEAHRLETSTSKPKRGLHSLGQVSGTLATLVQWIVGELELRGSSAVDALHTALRIRAANLNTGTPTANAELRAADVEVINDATAGAAALPKATGLQVAVTNASGKTITDAAALRLKLNNAGTITNPYAIFSEGPGITHLENFVEIKQSAAPATPATDFMRLYPKSDGKLYAKNWSGTEYDLTGGGSGGLSIASICNGRLTFNTGIPIPNGDVVAATNLYFTPFKGAQVALFNGTDWTLYSFTERTLSLAALLANTVYDIFLYDNAGTLTLEAVAWNAADNGAITSISTANPRVVTVPSHTLSVGNLVTIAGNSVAANNATWRVSAVTATTFTIVNLDATNPGAVAASTGGTWQRADQSTVRATSLTTQDGILVKSGAVTRRYLGTLRTTRVAGQSEDSRASRYLWNYYNRTERSMRIQPSVTSWAYGTAAWRAARNDLNYRFEFVIGYREVLVKAQSHMYGASTASVFGATGFALDDLNQNDADVNMLNQAGGYGAHVAVYNGMPDVGYHFLQPVEYATGASMNFYTRYNAAYHQGGWVAYLEA